MSDVLNRAKVIINHLKDARTQHDRIILATKAVNISHELLERTHEIRRNSLKEMDEILIVLNEIRNLIGEYHNDASKGN